MGNREALETHLNGFTDNENLLTFAGTKSISFDSETVLISLDPDKNERLVFQATIKYREFMQAANLSNEDDVDENIGIFTALPIDEVSRMAKIETLRFYAGQMEPNVSMTLPIKHTGIKFRP